MIHWLSVIKGRSAGKRYRLVDGQGTIGRGSSNQVRLIDAEVSRVHCRYCLSAGQLELADLESANGTYVNQKPIDTKTLKPGDEIRIGSIVLEYDRAKADDLANEFEGDTFHAETPPGGNALGRNLLDAEVIPGELTFASDEEEDSGRTIQVRSDLNFMYHASLATSGKSDRDEMLNDVVDLIFDWVTADRCCILLRNETSGKGAGLKLEAFRDRNQPSKHSREKQKRKKLKISQSIINYVKKYRVGILTSNADRDERIAGEDSILKIGIREAICVPIRGRGEMLGLIYADSLDATNAGDNRFNEDQLKLMIAIANQVAFAIENESYFHSLLKQERMATVGRTTATLSHHIKNVLQGVNGGSHLIEEGLAGGDLDMARAGWDIVSRNQDEVSKLVGDMLTISKPYTPTLILADPTAVIDKVIQQIQPQLSLRKIQCDWEPEEQLTTSMFDPEGLHRAIFNLVRIGAACCATDGDGQVSIRAKSSDLDGLQIDVWHNGTPVDVENAEDIFFSPSNSAAQTLNPIELAVCRKLVQGHGGEVTHDSQSDQSNHQSNRFTIWLPLIPTPPRSSDVLPQP